MTENNELQAWRGAVRAFRLAATVLDDPAPGLFADLATPEEDLRSLTQELPLVSFSPFRALPSDVAYGRGEPLHRPTRESDRLLDHITGSQVTRLVTGCAQDPHEPTVQPPVFSFRRSSASGVPAGQQQSSRSDQYVPGDSPDRSTAQARSSAPESGDRELEASTVEETSPYPYATADGRDIERKHQAEYQAIYPASLLNSLAEDALEAVEQRTPDAPVRPSGTSTPRLVPSEERTVRSREPDRKVRHDHEDDGHAPDEPGLEAHDNGAAALIGSLAEHLWAAEARVARRPPATGAGDDGGAARSVEASTWEQLAEEMVPGRTPFYFSGGADSKPADRLPVRPDQSDPDPTPEVASDRRPDADAFAALVNDALVRQARRHGVDLS